VGLEVLSEKPEQRGDVTVECRVVGGQFDGAQMNYRMRGKTGEWLIIDVVIEGVSLVSSYRDQFKDIMGRGGPERLLERMREKNEEPLEDD
jgi:phospholipid transport system substrate-binding protein